MRICSIAPKLTPAFEALGHEVLPLWPNGGQRFDLAQELASRAFVPDLVVQQESLGLRTLLIGLESIECPKVFWSIDTHLNLYWHRHYARLFDIVATPHVSIARGESVLPPLLRLSMPGVKRPWRPHVERAKDVAFVGRFTAHRPLRSLLADFLKSVCPEDALAIEQELNFSEMLDLYADSRIAPNEAIAREVNFRLMEAASCGALVLSQNVGEDQDTLFDVGEEIDVYNHVLELKSLIDFYRARPDTAERKARAAWERIQNEHLPIHRAQQIIDCVIDQPRSAVVGRDAAQSLLYAEVEMFISGMMATDSDVLLTKLAQHLEDPYAQALTLQVLAISGRHERLAEGLRQIMAIHSHHVDRQSNSDTLEVDLACSMAGLRLEDFSLARFFWLARQKRLRGDKSVAKLPESPVALCRAWAEDLMKAGLIFRPGQRFDAGRHLPASAVHCLFLAHSLNPSDQKAKHRLGSLLSHARGFDYIQLGQLSDQSLHKRDNWRLHLSLGFLNLRCFRLDEGIEEILWARLKAQEQGKTAAFDRMLASMDPQSSVRSALRM